MSTAPASPLSSFLLIWILVVLSSASISSENIYVLESVLPCWLEETGDGTVSCDLQARCWCEDVGVSMGAWDWQGRCGRVVVRTLCLLSVQPDWPCSLQELGNFPLKSCWHSCTPQWFPKRPWPRCLPCPVVSDDQSICVRWPEWQQSLSLFLLSVYNGVLAFPAVKHWTVWHNLHTSLHMNFQFSKSQTKESSN